MLVCGVGHNIEDNINPVCIIIILRCVLLRYLGQYLIGSLVEVGGGGHWLQVKSDNRGLSSLVGLVGLLKSDGLGNLESLEGVLGNNWLGLVGLVSLSDDWLGLVSLVLLVVLGNIRLGLVLSTGT